MAALLADAEGEGEERGDGEGGSGAERAEAESCVLGGGRDPFTPGAAAGSSSVDGCELPPGVAEVAELSDGNGLGINARQTCQHQLIDACLDVKANLVVDFRFDAARVRDAEESLCSVVAHTASPEAIWRILKTALA
jgi:hypothetical protein